MGVDDDDKRADVALIIREAAKLRDLAAAVGHDFLAFLLANVLDEAEATLRQLEARGW